MRSHDLTDDEAADRRYRQDPAWYREGSSLETAWSKEGHDLYVVATGEMRIVITYASGEQDILYYTSDLEKEGITNDRELGERGQDEESFYWSANPWFEVWSKKTSDYFSDPIFELDEAIQFALDFEKEERE